MHRARSREDRIALIGEIMRKVIVFIIGIFLVCEGLSARVSRKKASGVIGCYGRVGLSFGA